MSLLDDFMESSEAVHGTSTIQYGADSLIPINGFDGQDNVRVGFLLYFIYLLLCLDSIQKQTLIHTAYLSS
jgi:hypothetical protein